MTDHAETPLVDRLRSHAPCSADQAIDEAANALEALHRENEALRAEVSRKGQALRAWETAFWVADSFAVAIHDADGKCYSVRSQDYHVLNDLYCARAALSGHTEQGGGNG